MYFVSFSCVTITTQEAIFRKYSWFKTTFVPCSYKIWVCWSCIWIKPKNTVKNKSFRCKICVNYISEPLWTHVRSKRFIASLSLIKWDSTSISQRVPKNPVHLRHCCYTEYSMDDVWKQIAIL